MVVLGLIVVCRNRRPSVDRSDVLFGMTGWHTVWSQAIDERRATDPAVPVQQLFRESKELGCTGSLNLLYRYITQGRAEGERPVTTPRRLTRLLLTHPGRLRDSDTRLVQELTPGSPPSASPTCLTCTASPTASSLTAPP